MMMVIPLKKEDVDVKNNYYIQLSTKSYVMNTAMQPVEGLYLEPSAFLTASISHSRQLTA